ncbi:hypothetical protein [Rhizobium wenxiniae]|uniref:hypothetical protein n=1 Tax=Rhizobium wenxiniae TaxID=1737357 RepID=UPI003C28D9F6
MVAALIAVEFDQFEFIDELTNTTELALIRALNKTAERSRTRISREARNQVAFPASYLSPSSRRLWVSSKARSGSFETEIEGRGAATSLARFTKQKPVAAGRRHRNGEVAVTVKPGATRRIKRAFLIRLNNNNVGLAVRTNGEKPENAFKPKSLGPNLWLLYGPSVDQALTAATDGKGVYEDMTPDMLDFLETEFNRQLEVLGA